MAKTTSLKTFNADMDRRRALAAAVESSPDYLWQLGVRWDHKKAGVILAQKIERESERIWRRVPKETLRPDVWGNESHH